ncbi:energy transducer TonB [Stakelama sp. CBK3Z-3]|uniref:Energy transducer TonB n=1 Tax=Stakelama flava TaxID=2860338 RepID=A0ABS6XME9_9SPHN|nr:energy transducer TonB [Stakelama flava]
MTSRATEVQAAPPVLKPDPPPVPAAIQAATGADSTSGNADVAGPGTGAGGEGQGTGSGRSGNGPGGGGADSPPRRIGGRLSIRDLPPDIVASVRQGELTVGVLYRVRSDGRVDDCRIERSSGNRAIDAITCRLIEARFRYDPSRRPSGEPVESYIEENHSWVIENLPPRR